MTVSSSASSTTSPASSPFSFRASGAAADICEFSGTRGIIELASDLVAGNEGAAE